MTVTMLCCNVWLLVLEDVFCPLALLLCLLSVWSRHKTRLCWMIDEVGRDPGCWCWWKVLPGQWSPAQPPYGDMASLCSQPRGETAAGAWEHQQRSQQHECSDT